MSKKIVIVGGGFAGVKAARELAGDPRFAVTLTRKLNNDTYTLPPNDARYVLPIPQQEIDVTNGVLKQNNY